MRRRLCYYTMHCSRHRRYWYFNIKWRTLNSVIWKKKNKMKKYYTFYEKRYPGDLKRGFKGGGLRHFWCLIWLSFIFLKYSEVIWTNIKKRKNQTIKLQQNRQQKHVHNFLLTQSFFYAHTKHIMMDEVSFKRFLNSLPTYYT